MFNTGKVNGDLLQLHASLLCSLNNAAPTELIRVSCRLRLRVFLRIVVPPTFRILQKRKAAAAAIRFVQLRIAVFCAISL